MLSSSFTLILPRVLMKRRRKKEQNRKVTFIDFTLELFPHN